MKDFWLSCGHHLLDRDDNGALLVTDEFIKAYLARPELGPPDDACMAERMLHAALLANPHRELTSSEIAAIADPDARENWTFMIEFRDRLLAPVFAEPLGKRTCNNVGDPARRERHYDVNGPCRIGLRPRAADG